MSFIIADIFGPSTESDRHPVNRPEILGSALNAAGIGSILKEGKAVISWYSLADEKDFFYGYRVECGKIICKYRGVIKNDGIHWMLQEAYLLNDASINSLWTDELSKFGHLYYDDGHMDDQLFFVHDVTLDEILASAHDAEPFYVNESRFKKRRKRKLVK